MSGFVAAQPSIFGTQPTTNTGFTFGAPNTTQSTSLRFGGTTSNTPAFGTGQVSSFGTPTFGTSTTIASTGFGIAQPTFGTNTSSGFGTTASTAPIAFGTTTPAIPSNAFNFSTPAPQSFPSFGLQNQTRPQTSFNFSTTTTSAAPTFGGTLGAPGFTFPQTQQSLLGQPQQLQQQIDPQHAFYQSIFQCHKFGDERDNILANFNYLQACAGSGKGFYSQTLPPVTYTSSNPFYRFKAVGYVFMYTDNNEDGIICFKIKKSAEKVRNEETQLISTLQTFINRTNIIFKISGVKGVSEEQSTVNVYAEDQNNLRRIPATDLAGIINQPHLKAQLDTLGISNVCAKVRPSPAQLKHYLDNAPEGIDPRVWKQAQDDNPDPDNMIPKPIIGVDDLKDRVLTQEKESEHHNTRISLIQNECTKYQNRCSSIATEVLQIKRKQAQLQDRLLAVISRQEIHRKGNAALYPHEIELSRELQTVSDELSSPTEYKGRLKELLSHLRLQQHRGASSKYTIDETSLHEIKEFLTIQQKSMKYLVETIKSDLENLQLIMTTADDPKVKVYKESYQNTTRE